VFLLAAIVVLLLARIPVIPVRFFDPDEFQHAHAAWSVWRGLVPYRDFFEHHTPGYYFALSPFFHGFAVDQSFEQARGFLLFARALSLALTALLAVLAYRVGRLGGDRRVGLLAALFLVGQPVVIQKTLEIRPDVLALVFFVGCLGFLLRGLREEGAGAGPSPRRLFAGGLCLGAAVLCTQKMLFVLPGALIGLGLWVLMGRGGRWRARSLAGLCFAVGVALPVALTGLGFAVAGGGSQFIRNNFLLNARWRQHSNEHLLVTLATSWPMLVLCLLGAGASLYRGYRSRRMPHGALLLLCILGGLVAGILVVPAAYKQYYLPLLAIACLFAAQGLAVLVARARDGARVWLLIAATVPLLIWPVVELARSWSQHDAAQMARLHYVFAHTRPGEPVLDGWLGTGVFRPHPLYYFFIHSELLTMLSPQEVDSCLDALESGQARPALIAMDWELAAMGSRLVRFVQRNYESRDGLFYLPRPGLGPP
jgi:4-amino-4-deoxy-L-arabinose transferase-like glycosyltransferase